MAHLLVVDDDRDNLHMMQLGLSVDGHEVQTAESAGQAMELIQKQMPDLIVLDIMMPEKDGLTFCQELKEDARYQAIPVLFLSALWATQDVIKGLDAGGDDYVTKPFNVRELRARVRALLRRAPADGREPPRYVVDDLTLDVSVCQASTSRAELIQLTQTECRLLRHLMAHKDEVCTVGALLQEVWGYPKGAGDPDVVRTHIRRLRMKINSDDGETGYIRTVRGKGYMIKSSAQPEQDAKKPTEKPDKKPGFRLFRKREAQVDDQPTEKPSAKPDSNPNGQPDSKPATPPDRQPGAAPDKASAPPGKDAARS